MQEVKQAVQSSPPKIYLWLRNVGDIFALWPHGKQQLNNFIHLINSMHTGIEFIIEIGEEGRLTSWLKEETTDALDTQLHPN